MSNWYKETLEALGMRGRRASILNKLNRVVAHSNDPKLREMVGEVVERVDGSSVNTDHTPIRKMKAVNASALQEYCEARAYNAQN